MTNESRRPDPGVLLSFFAVLPPSLLPHQCLINTVSTPVQYALNNLPLDSSGNKKDVNKEFWFGPPAIATSFGAVANSNKNSDFAGGTSVITRLSSCKNVKTKQSIEVYHL
jgi:hypothetical protein